jgi:hypothetical protein
MLPEEIVWVKDTRTWGKILKQADTPRSYIVETPNGTIRRNSFHLTSAHRQEEESWPEDEENEDRDEQQLGPAPAEDQSSPERQRQQQTPPDPRYRTRSGRVVNPPNR